MAEWITADEIRHIFVEIYNGRGNHGSFLRKFADAYLQADALNVVILHDVSQKIIAKYNLDKYLDNFAECR